MGKHIVAVFSNVSFENHGNQSLRNFIEGFLLSGYQVYLITIASNYEEKHVKEFAETYPNLCIINPIFSGHDKRIKNFIKDEKYRSKSKIKALFRYKRFSSNSEINQWLSIISYASVIKKMVRFVKLNQPLVESFESTIFIDIYGGILAQTFKIFCPVLWKKIYHRTVGYYLGTVLKQFRGNISAFLTMPISFLGSYRPVVSKLIITNDGTDGEAVFRKKMLYRGPILFLWNGVDERLLSLKNNNEYFDTPRLEFVTCSRLTKWKRVDRVIRFIGAIKRKSSHKVHLSIIGDGDERSFLEDLVKQENITEEVIFLGGLKYEEAIEYISKHKFYIIFNDLSNLGNQVFEAISLGLIPVTIDDGSTDSILKNGENSIKVPLGKSFADKAADTFLQIQSENKFTLLFNNIAKTKNSLYSWRRRNEIEQTFLFLDSKLK
jgi:glycosyltransferase involved in cell wall biosynthesis